MQTILAQPQVKTGFQRGRFFKLSGRCAMVLAILTLGACTGSPRPASSTLPPGKLGDILARGTLVIATDPEYPPQSELLTEVPRIAETRCANNQFTANQFAGFDVDVAVELSERLGVEACFVTPAWTQLISGNWDNRWDISVGSMVITQVRMQSLYFTQPYTSGAAILFVHEDNQTFNQPSDLSSKVIGVCTGCAYEFYLEGTLELPGQEIKFIVQDPVVIGYDTDTSALADLALGDSVVLDAVLTDPDTGQAAIAGGLPIKALGAPLYYDFVSAAIDKKSSKDPLSLVARVNEIIQAMHQDGTLRKLSMQYYGDDFSAAASAFDIHSLEQSP